MIRLVLLGANNPETIRLIEDINALRSQYRIEGWVDNDAAKHGASYLGFPVLGSPEVLARPEYRDCQVVNNVTRNGRERQKTSQQLEKLGLPFATLVHPRVNARHVHIGPGVIVHHGAMLEAACRLEAHSAIANGAVIGHDATVGRYSFVAANSVVAGSVILEEAVTIWIGAVVTPRLRIGRGAVVGANAAVFANVGPDETVMGNPARRIPT
jgi:sugar O-acyltransferase (sialic acid O-acetyltransferase NeuD family)